MARRKTEGKSTVTLKTIADAVGVSVTTVARALKDGDKISPEMIGKVRQTADALGYVRNMDGVKLRTGKTFVVMAFLSASPEEEIGDSGSVGILNGIHKRFADTDYAVRAVPVTIGESCLDLIQNVVQGRNADGIIFDHTEPQDDRIKYLLEQDTPFVAFGRAELFSQFPYFDIDNEFSAYQGTKALLDHGYRKIALIDGDERFMFIQQRRRGYQKALQEAGISFNRDLVRNIPALADVARREAKELAKSGADAFVCVNELVFLGARAGVRDALGLEALKTGYAIRSGTNLGDYLDDQLFSSYYSRQQAGWNLADTLIRRMDGAPISDCQIVEQTELRLPTSLLEKS